MARSESVHILERLAPKLPFFRYFEALRGLSFPFLLDSASDPGRLGRFSFLGASPRAVLRARRASATLGDGPRRPRTGRISRLRANVGDGSLAPRDLEGDPFAELRAMLAEHAVDPAVFRGRPVPLLAGAIGYVGFGAAHFLEALPDHGRDELGLPDVHLGMYDTLLAHCHRTGSTWLSVLGRGPTRAAARASAQRSRDALLARIEAFERAARADDDDPSARPRRANAETSARARHATEADYVRRVERAKEHILAGDAFELCLTHQIRSPFAGDPWELYRELRRINPAPFASYLELPEAAIVSSSPERFLRLDPDGAAESRPIKGTRPRGATEAEDRALAEDLAASVKDRAENTMIVDLVRSDLGRVCRFGSVHVPELQIIESYATVHQMVSTVRGRLTEDRDAIDVLRACFPGGSMTGAPKIEALTILDGLEPDARGVYSGAIGYIDLAGAMDLSIVIRTILVKDGTAHYGVGGAVVADSDPRGEYEETMTKARALMTALARVARP